MPSRSGSWRTWPRPAKNQSHLRRYLTLKPRPGGGWIGRFECGQAQGALIERILQAGSGPRPGLGIDQAGVQHQIPDLRSSGARRMDALTDFITYALGKN